MTRVQTFTFSPYQTNSYVCYNAGEAVLIDASASNAAEQSTVVRFIQSQGLVLRHLLLTHAHIDHILGCAFFARHYCLSWQAHRDCKTQLRFAKAQAAMFGTTVKQPPPLNAYLQEGDRVSFGNATWEVLDTPGHAPGSISFYDRDAGFVMVGDVLFHDSIGRYDLPGGRLPILMRSIFEKLLTLPDSTTVYAGHGQATTIGRERSCNPFLIQ